MRSSALGIIITILCIFECGGGSGSNGRQNNTDDRSPLGDIYPIDGVVDFSDFNQIYKQTLAMGATADQVPASQSTIYHRIMINDAHKIITFSLVER